MSDQTPTTVDDDARLVAIQRATDPRVLVAQIAEYYVDLERVQRTPFAQTYIHLGMLLHALTRLLPDDPPSTPVNPDDLDRIIGIMHATADPDRRVLVSLIDQYYQDAARTARTARGQMSLHIGNLVGAFGRAPVGGVTLTVTASQRDALVHILASATHGTMRMQVYRDTRRGVDVTPEELLELVQDAEPVA